MLSYSLILFHPVATGSLVAIVDDDGTARGHGAIHVRDGTSNTILVADGSADASCADTDGDGTAGLARMTFELRDIRTGARLTAEISPIAGDIDRQGRVKVKFPDRGGTDPLEVEAQLVLRGFDTSHR